jgi:hypothetical protein
MKTKTPTAFAWNVDSAEVDRVVLSCPPVPRVLPDGCRVTVSVHHEERTYHDSARPIGERHVVEPYRVASVSLTTEDGTRDKVAASVRFATTPASGHCYGRIEESVGYVDGPDAPARPYFRMTSSQGTRLDGFWEDLPAGAYDCMRDTFTSAAAYVAEHLPHLWQGAEVTRAAGRLTDAESALDKARAEVKAARADLRAAERVHRKAVPAT